MNATTAIRISVAGAALVVTAGCGHLDGLTPEQGRLAGGGAGALVGAIATGGIIAPVLGAVGGVIAGEELAEPDPVID